MTRRVLGGLGAGCALVLALPAAVYLHGSTLLALFLAAGVASSLAAALGHRETDGAPEALRRAATAAVGTVSTVVVLASIAFLLGATAASRIGLVAMPVLAIGWLVRRHRPRLVARPSDLPGRASRPTGPAPEEERVHLVNAPVAVLLLPTSALGREWLRTSAELARALRPAVRDALAARRHEVLDELECRDPAGFRAWLDAGAGPASDPAAFVRRGRAGSGPA